ncbi:MAG TPA: sulfur carrier protein ThiS [Pseudogracilibacillus sp.]|nr:sulfur carrier protein ThiS [Pseudogracilibacillus sp.]
MEIRINGNDVTIPENLTTIQDVINHYQFKSPIIIVEHNDHILKKEDYDQTKLKPGDHIEFVQFVGGG